MAIPSAPASFQMIDKLLDRSFVQRRGGFTFPPNPMNQVLGRSNVPPRGYLCIARLAQLLREPFKHVAVGATA
jgi:hypothetical protein